jgi:hypothetical protein
VVWAALLARPGFAALAGTARPAGAVAAMARDPQLRERARRRLGEQGCAGPDGFGAAGC